MSFHVVSAFSPKDTPRPAKVSLVYITTFTSHPGACSLQCKNHPAWMEDVSKIIAAKIMCLGFFLMCLFSKFFSKCSPSLKWTLLPRLKFRSLMWQIKINQNHYRMCNIHKVTDLPSNSGRWNIFVGKFECCLTLTWNRFIFMKRSNLRRPKF